MHYLSVGEGRSAPGLRLVLTAGVPGPWGEAAKAILKFKGLAWSAVAQEAGGENAELIEWTGQASAPVLVHEDEPPACDSLDILFLAERLAPSPSLIPEDPAARVQMFGLAREIIGRRGLGWERRVMMLSPMAASPKAPAHLARLAARYDCRPGLEREAPERVAAILRHLSGVLAAQGERGSPWFVGDAPTAVDLYWASFSNMVAPLPEADCPMPAYMRAAYENSGPVVAAALDPALIRHRDRVWRDLIGLPMDFLAD